MKKNDKLKKSLLASLILLLALVAGVCVFLKTSVLAKYDGSTTATIAIPGGSTEEDIRALLCNEFGEAYASKVMRLWRWQGGKAVNSTGYYEFEPGTTALRTARNIAKRRQTPVSVTFNNIRTMDELAARMAGRMEFSADSFLTSCDSILPQAGFTPPQYPAAFIPDSYEFYWTDTPCKVVNTMLGVRNRFWNDSRRKQAAKLGLTPVEVATVASIVEEETVKEDERPTVARLYLNRIAREMPLQADPTVKFALGDFTLKRIYNKHLKTPSPYNTYLHRGLPPGPIRIVERSTLEAVLSAPEHNYVFMCARPDFSGYHNFTASDREHARNAEAYRKALNKKGIQ